jgi:hypothetical protein
LTQKKFWAHFGRFFSQTRPVTLVPTWAMLFQKSGLPDGLFSNLKSQFGLILEGLAMENLGISYDH